MPNEIILASRSNARKRLLELLGYSVIVKPSFSSETFMEKARLNEAIEVTVKNAINKLSKFSESNVPIVSADTVIWLNDRIYGKPKNKREARNILCNLSGKTHIVITSIAVKYHGNVFCDTDLARVKMRKYNMDEIDFYLGKTRYKALAGAYAIQTRGAMLIEKIIGSPYTVIGLPTHIFIRFMKKISYWPPVSK